MISFKWNDQSGGRHTPVEDLLPSTSNSDVPEPAYDELNSQLHTNYHPLNVRAQYTSHKSWGYWKFYVDILNAYNRENVESYEYAPNGKDLISTPSGFGKNVPVSQETSDGHLHHLFLKYSFRALHNP